LRQIAKKYVLGLCLFVFLFVVLGGALRLSPSGALLAAGSGTALLIFVFNRVFSHPEI
jgi:hypothetical protein